MFQCNHCWQDFSFEDRYVDYSDADKLHQTPLGPYCGKCMVEYQTAH